MPRRLLPLFACSLFLAVSAHAADKPTLLKRTVAVSQYRYLRYWPNPKAKEPQYNTWSWVPKLSFEVLGPVKAGSQWTVEFQKPGGKPWLSLNCRTDEYEDDVIGDIVTPDVDEKKATTATGIFPFKIRLKSGGASTVVFSGNYEVKTYLADQKIPEYKGKREFYVDEDWRLPIGFVWGHPRIDEDAPPLSAQMWFRNVNSNDVTASVFYNGKEIDSVKYPSSEQELKTGLCDAAHTNQLLTFYFVKVRIHDNANNPIQGDGFTFLDKNPGEYTIKVSTKGKPSREAKFTVGDDGKISDDGIAAANNMGGVRQILRVKVLGTNDNAPNAAVAANTKAFYGNPLKGFKAP